MKTSRIKNLFFALTVLCAGSLSAQATIVSPSDTIYAALDTMNVAGEISSHWYVMNETSTPMTLMCTRNLVDVVSPFNYPYVYDVEAGEVADGSYEKFCWGPICYNYGTDASSTNSSLLVEMAPGETNETFIAYFYAHDIVGTSTLEYCFHPVDDIAEGSCKSITYVITATAAIEDEILNPASFSAVYPNPLEGAGFVNYQLNQGDEGTVVFRDLMGKEIKRMENLVLSGTIQIDANEFSSGIGFCTLKVNGIAVRTERFVVVR